ncbi:MAG: DJ-1/PfpI family protein [Methanomicrobiaceae archaeon]|uniref:Thij/pfpi family protein n=1 Tax=hydrocarbon metagenome TaxID=938273 RepID=A0A0W8FI99_9ZZZZ|nr:DJ-1/PfpI family protein [Methanomicrobiaceae archaeon]MDD5419540.1 DJ-1/PfpI family protein [Methanomicrobiaceae archaeon]
MKLLLAIAPERFRDEELEKPSEIFAEAGIEYDIASTRTGACSGMLGCTAEATLTFEEADPDSYDGIVVVGGMGAKEYLWEDEPLRTLVRAFFGQGKVVAAICLAPVVFARAGILGGRQATVFSTDESRREMEKGGANLVKIPVVADMQIVTASGPDAAAAFAETIIQKLEC